MPKKVETIDLAAIAEMEDDVDGAIEKTDSTINLFRRVRGL
jgi:hypothetical protein